MLVDDVAGGHRQAERRLVVELVERGAERHVQLLQSGQKREGEPEGIGHAEVEISQHVELELRAPAHGPPVLRQLGRKGDEGGADERRLDRVERALPARALRSW